MFVTVLQVIFWILVFLVFYSYVGYGILMFFLVKIKRVFKGKAMPDDDFEPEVTLLVAAFNEEDYIREKIENSFSLDYPKSKLQFLFVTDGSNDRTPAIVQEYEEIKLLHQTQRQGKIAATERAMQFVETDFVVFTDANTILNKDAIKKMVRHFKSDRVGAVAGEKRILQGSTEEAIGAGEGIYWKYESTLKKWDSELCTVVGAAGELFAIRTSIFEAVPKDSIIEDFYMTLRIAQRGYKVVYEPEAYALEEPSASVSEELKRKIRIAAGGIQSIMRLKPLLNLFRYGWLSFEYISHRVLRWTLAPLALPLIIAINFLLALIGPPVYLVIFTLQAAFYLAAWAGYVLEKQQIKVKALFIPYYFSMMNYAVYKGMIRYKKGQQSVMWEKAKRREATTV